MSSAPGVESGGLSVPGLLPIHVIRSNSRPAAHVSVACLGSVALHFC